MAAPTEFELIARYFTRSAPRDDVLLGIGDDAAVIDCDGPTAVTVDTLCRGTHFPDDFPAEALGHRILAVNLSDLAAMGARPRWATLSLTVERADLDWFEAFADGLFALAERFGVALVGGDLCRGPLSASLQLLGSFDGDARLTRGGARVGDDIYVTGTLGDAAGGLALMTAAAADRGAAAAELRARFEKPSPRVAAGLELAPIATAAIDVSDGLLADLGHICEASGCAAVIDADALPLSAALGSVHTIEQAVAYALGGGDDYELCFTAPPARAEAIAAAAAASATPCTRIGAIEAGSGVRCLRSGQAWQPPSAGYRHF